MGEPGGARLFHRFNFFNDLRFCMIFRNTIEQSTIKIRTPVFEVVRRLVCYEAELPELSLKKDETFV